MTRLLAFLLPLMLLSAGCDDLPGGNETKKTTTTTTTKTTATESDDETETTPAVTNTVTGTWYYKHEVMKLTQSGASIQGSTSLTIAFNNDLPMWKDERVRRAISLTVDRPTLTKLVYGALGKAVPVPDWRFFWDEEPTAESGRLGKWWKTDIAQAKQLLQAAGQENFAFEMVYYNYTPQANSLQNQVLVDQLRASGIQLKATSVEYSQFNSQWTTRKGDAQAYDGWLSFSPTAEQYVYGLHHSKSPGNRYRINDPEIDAWADQHQVELDPAKRRDLAQKVWNKVYDQVYRVDKPTAFAISVSQPWIRGLRTGRGIGSGQHYLDIQNVARFSWIDK